MVRQRVFAERDPSRYPTTSWRDSTTCESYVRASTNRSFIRCFATADLSGLAPADAGRSCTDDLGPRWMLVYSHGRDLTGVVVDDFGCGDVRLTDDPFETAPGDAAQEGIVPGVLADPAGLLNDLRTIHRRREAR